MSADFSNAASTVSDLRTFMQGRRELLGLSMREVARQAGIPVASVHRIEHGKGCHSTTVVSVLTWLASDSPQQCDLPPNGWWCSRARGHDGPCAARQNGGDDA